VSLSKDRRSEILASLDRRDNSVMKPSLEFEVSVVVFGGSGARTIESKAKFGDENKGGVDAAAESARRPDTLESRQISGRYCYFLGWFSG
jgi:hypothetical protein